MVIKQDTRGTCFAISDAPMDWLLPQPRPSPDHEIGVWEHTTHSSLRNPNAQAGPGAVPGNCDEPPF